MNKSLNSAQMLLFVLAAVLLLLAAFSFYLLRDPSAPLPFSPSTATQTSTLPPPTQTPIRPSSTPVPTRQTSYTPFATLLTPLSGTSAGTPGITTEASSTITPSNIPSGSGTPLPTYTPSITPIPTTPSITSTPTITPTLSTGEIGITGRVLQYGTPMANLVVEFKDDVASRKSTTNNSGHYWFTSLAPGTAFTLSFRKSDNNRLSPASEVAFLEIIEGNLRTGINPIDLPDLEVSLNLNNMMFELQSPADGATYSAAVISASNPIQFSWSLYNLGGVFRIELGPTGSDQPIWTSTQIASTNYMWDGTLNDGTHITHGTYWWRVSATRSLVTYLEEVYAQPLNISFNP